MIECDAVTCDPAYDQDLLYRGIHRPTLESILNYG